MYNRLSHTIAVEHELDPLTSVKARLSSFGRVEAALSTRLSTNLTATVSAGGSAAGFFTQKNLNPSHIGLNLKFNV